jgi:CheY-like chemotaxis protein
MGAYILIVEDDAAMLDALEMELSSRGYEVRGAANGAEALALIRQELPMLILTDLAMPVMNGRKMLQLLRAEPLGHDVPVIILSAFGYEWEAELMQAQGFIKKPVRVAQLEQEIARVLGGPSLARTAMLN